MTNIVVMLAAYRKGYMGEWQLTHKLAEMGYMVVRTPRSGRIGLASPDIIAAKQGKLIVIECKSRAQAFTVPPEQLDELKEWQESYLFGLYDPESINERFFTL